MATALKNQVKQGCVMLPMNDETYALRRSVMGIIYEAKKFVTLPRVEVRIVETTPCLMGYAKMGQNIIHIGAKYAKESGKCLEHVVLHEILHAVKSTKHDPKCPLMNASYTVLPQRVIWDSFKKYF